MNETPTLYAPQHRVFSLNIINLLYIKDMSKESKETMAVR